MKHCPPDINTAVPAEFRKITGSLFPSGNLPADKKDGLAATEGFAQALGIGTEYKRLLNLKRDSAEMLEFLGHFQHNLDLLIQKTWVEKAEESLKEKLLDELPPFMNLIEQKKYIRALEKFGFILDELAYLFFGTQSNENDFAEYTFRIDTQIGLFWWYCSRLNGLKDTCGENITDNDTLWAVLLIGICYLTNF